jgi:hypothetical protein
MIQRFVAENCGPRSSGAKHRENQAIYRCVSQLLDVGFWVPGCCCEGPRRQTRPSSLGSDLAGIVYCKASGPSSWWVHGKRYAANLYNLRPHLSFPEVVCTECQNSSALRFRVRKRKGNRTLSVWWFHVDQASWAVRGQLSERTARLRARLWKWPPAHLPSCPGPVGEGSCRRIRLATPGGLRRGFSCRFRSPHLEGAYLWC